jgi:hypothetical protein
MLSTETDLLIESNQEIEDQIKRIIERGKLSDQEREVIRN